MKTLVIGQQFGEEFLSYTDPKTFENSYNVFQYKKLYSFYKTNPKELEKRGMDDNTTSIPIFKNMVNLRDIVEVLKEATSSNFYSFLYNMSQKNCKNRVEAHFETEKISMNNKEETKSKIFDILSNGQSPVITINSNKFFRTKKSILEKISSALGGDHAVSIVGTQLVNDKCFLKISGLRAFNRSL